MQLLLSEDRKKQCRQPSIWRHIPQYNTSVLYNALTALLQNRLIQRSLRKRSQATSNESSRLQ